MLIGDTPCLIFRCNTIAPTTCLRPTLGTQYTLCRDRVGAVVMQDRCTYYYYYYWSTLQLRYPIEVTTVT